VSSRSVTLLWVLSHNWQSCLTVLGIANNLAAKARDAGRAVRRYDKTHDIANTSGRHMALVLGMLAALGLVGLASLSMWGRLKRMLKVRSDALPTTTQYKDEGEEAASSRARASSDEFSISLVIS